MKKIALAIVALALLLPLSTMAQATSNGTLQVTANVVGSISMVIDSATGGPVLTNPNTSAASVTLNGVSATNAPAGTTITPGTTSFTLNVPFAVNVTRWNSASTGFNVTAELSSADAVNTWAIGGTALNATSYVAAGGGSNLAYGADRALTLNITIPQSNSTGSVTNTVRLMATAI